MRAIINAKFGVLFVELILVACIFITKVKKEIFSTKTWQILAVLQSL